MDRYSVSAEEIRRLGEELESPLPSRRSEAQNELDEIANHYRFEGVRITADDNAERDEVIAMLSHHGAPSFKAWHLGEY